MKNTGNVCNLIFFPIRKLGSHSQLWNFNTKLVCCMVCVCMHFCVSYYCLENLSGRCVEFGITVTTTSRWPLKVTIIPIKVTTNQQTNKVQPQLRHYVIDYITKGRMGRLLVKIPSFLPKFSPKYTNLTIKYLRHLLKFMVMFKLCLWTLCAKSCYYIELFCLKISFFVIVLFLFKNIYQ